MRGKRTDLEIQAEIISRLIKGELGADIARDLGVHESTVSRIKDGNLQEVARESEIIAKIIENDMESVKNMSEITERFTRELKIKDELDRADVTVANTTTESALKRAQLLGGKATERIDIGDFSNKTQKELEMIRQQELL